MKTLNFEINFRNCYSDSRDIYVPIRTQYVRAN